MVGLPRNILHGLYSMAQVARAQTEAAGSDPRALRRLKVQFRGMGVPEEEIVVSGTVRERDGDRVVIDTEAVQAGQRDRPQRGGGVRASRPLRRVAIAAGRAAPRPRRPAGRRRGQRDLRRADLPDVNAGDVDPRRRGAVLRRLDPAAGGRGRPDGDLGGRRPWARCSSASPQRSAAPAASSSRSPRSRAVGRLLRRLRRRPVLSGRRTLPRITGCSPSARNGSSTSPSRAT